jgi:hypothetical protein
MYVPPSSLTGRGGDGAPSCRYYRQASNFP